MEGSKVSGAKHAAAKMLTYYIGALIEEGDPDPKRTVATRLGEMINLSEEQVEFVMNASYTGSSTFLKDLDDIIQLLLLKDDKSIEIAIQMTKAIKDKANDAIHELGLDYFDNGKG